MTSPSWRPSLGLVALLCSCQQQPAPLTEAQQEEIVAQITARHAELVSTFEALDAEAFAEILSRDNFLAYVTIEHYFDRQAFVDTVAVWFAPRESQQFDRRTLNVYPLTPDLAIADMTHAGVVTTNDGTRMEGHSVFTFLWQREAAEWYIIHYNESVKYAEVVE